MKLHLPLSIRQILLLSLLSVPSPGADVGSSWDPAWGAEGLAGAPDADAPQYVAEITSGGVTALVPPSDGTGPYDFGTYTAITLRGTGNAGAIIVGGASATQSNATGAVSRNSWIAAESGTYDMLVGGSYADNWDGGATFDFTGNSHIMVAGASVNYIVGGNLKDGQAASFTGNSYITVAEGAVTGSIVGATVVTHNRICAFNGDTHIFVYVPLADNSGAGYNQLPNNMIMGGFGWATNTRQTQTLDGSTHVTVDLSDYSGAESVFAKHIVGGGFNGSGSNAQVITGDTAVSVNLGSRSCSARVVGGMWVNSGRGELSGMSRLSVTGGTFDNIVLGGSWTDVGGTTTRLGGVQMLLSGSTFNDAVLGATYITTGACTMNCGEVNIELSGGAVLHGSLTGGYRINGDNDAQVAATLGDVNILLADGTVGAVTGGSHTLRNSASSVISQGSINIRLLSGSVGGDVYAAGYQGGSTSMQTTATTVSLAPAVELSPGITVSGGYGGANVSSSVTGERSLIFEGGSYDIAADIVFADFDAVSVPGGTAVALGAFRSDGDTLSKYGAGGLSLAVNPQFRELSVEGALDLPGGTDGAQLESLTMAAGASLAGVSGTVTAGGEGGTVLNLAIGTGNVGAGAAANPLIMGVSGGTVDMELQGGQDVTLDLSAEGLMELLLEHRDALPPVTSYLTLVDGELTCTNPAQLGINTLLNTYGLRVNGAAEGSLLVSGSVEGIYFVTADAATTDPHVVTTYSTLGLYAGVIIDENQQLTFTLPGDFDPGTRVTVNNLMGAEGSNMTVLNTGERGTVTVLLSNQAVDDTGDGAYPTLPARTVMQGSISGGTGTELLKVGPGELVLGGNLSADAAGVLEGTLSLHGADNVVNSMQVMRGVLRGGSSGNSRLTVQQQLRLADTAQLRGLHLVLAPAAAADFGAATGVELLSLRGGSTLQGSGAQISLLPGGQSRYSGELRGLATLNNGGNLFLDNVTSAPGAVWNINNTGTLTADVIATRHLTLGTLTLGSGSVNELVLDTDTPFADSLRLHGLAVEQGRSTVRLSSVGARFLRSGDYVIGRVSDSTAIDVQGQVNTELQGLPFAQLLPGRSYLYTDRAGNIVLHAVRSPRNLLLPYADSANSAAGAHLLWESEPPGHGDLSRAYAELLQLISGGQRRAAARALAALAGSSTATLVPALTEDVERQLRNIRNRMATMGVNPCVVNDDMPYYNFWVQAEGDYRHLDAAGHAPGYKFNRWGGTVGVDVDVNPAFTAGLAVSGLYGELSTDSPDRLDCDVSTWYLSAFARYLSRPWVHNIAATLGWVQADPDRRVNVGSLLCNTRGATDGHSFGLMYELAYNWQPDVYDPDFTLQPLLNISYRHSSVGAYTESGSDAALRVDPQGMDSLRLSLGARLQAAFGENIYNRKSVLECRVLSGFDIGDRRGQADVALVNGRTRDRVQSARPGAFGVELGAGLAVPLGQEDGTLFLDGAVLLRSHQSEFQATVGYRNQF
ncbi:MAG: autotransporter outer membrane beta-barrel domain-containing protein [Akkermansia sp.]|nr:autotransporter outer membrane beta-barrel domain-containing protein [Akkermansia sp.]